MYQKTIKKDCKCPICEKCILESKEENNSKDKICELDMANKTDLEVYDLCDDQGISNESNVKIRNISSKVMNLLIEMKENEGHFIVKINRSDKDKVCDLLEQQKKILL